MQDKKMIFMMLLCATVLSCFAADHDSGFDNIEAMMEQIEKELVESGRFELFKTIQKVYKMLHPQSYMTPYPTFKTNAGSELYIVFERRPIHLCMLWGRLDIEWSMDYEQQIDDLKLAFESNSGERRYKHANPFIEPSFEVRFYKKVEQGEYWISEDELQEHRGKETRIIADSRGCFSCYKILEVKGKPLPEQKIREVEKNRSIDDIRYEWSILSIMHSKEQVRKWSKSLDQGRH